MCYVIKYMKNNVKKVLEECSHCGAWYGQKINSLNDRNSLNDTPLHTVCSWGDIKPVEILISAGANINSKGDQGNTPLFNAITRAC